MEPFPDRHFKTWTIDEVRAATEREPIYYMPGSKRLRLGALLAAVVVLCGGVTAARADGDPASDILASDTLPFHDVFLPVEPVSPALAQELRDTVAAANKGGFRIKVALIAAPADLGSVSVLFNMPMQYAKFLGAELIGLYHERLLVVMPAGFGLVRGALPTLAENAVLDTIAIGEGANGLARAAIDAVNRLDDTERPTANALPGSGRRGRKAFLRYTVGDDSGFAGAKLTLARGGTRIASFSSAIRSIHGARVSTIAWLVPKRTSIGVVAFCVVASDPAGNRSAPSCAPITIR